MGGKAICSESTVLQVSERTREFLERADWFQYLTKLQVFHEEITLEFLQNLQNGHTMVKGRNITVSEAVISKVSELPVEGTRCMDKHVLLQDTIAVFQDPDEQLVRKGKGIHPTYLRQPW